MSSAACASVCDRRWRVLLVLPVRLLLSHTKKLSAPAELTPHLSVSGSFWSGASNQITPAGPTRTVHSSDVTSVFPSIKADGLSSLPGDELLHRSVNTVEFLPRVKRPAMKEPVPPPGPDMDATMRSLTYIYRP